MSDKDKQKDDDIISAAEDAPETISDDDLENVDGGAWTLRNVQVTGYSFGGSSAIQQPNMETIYGGAGNDMIVDPGALLSRKGTLKR